MSDTVYTYPSLFLAFHFLLLSVCKPSLVTLAFRKACFFFLRKVHKVQTHSLTSYLHSQKPKRYYGIPITIN
jgi:hypothetical protein